VKCTLASSKPVRKWGVPDESRELSQRKGGGCLMELTHQKNKERRRGGGVYQTKGQEAPGQHAETEKKRKERGPEYHQGGSIEGCREDNHPDNQKKEKPNKRTRASFLKKHLCSKTCAKRRRQRKKHRPGLTDGLSCEQATTQSGKKSGGKESKVNRL